MDKNKINETLSLAHKNHKENNLDIAENLYEEILKIDSKNFDAIFLLGTLLSQKKKFDRAKALLFKASQINPRSAKVQNNLGTALLKLNKFEESINCYEKALEIDPSYPRAHDNLTRACELYAKTLFKKGLHREAMNCIQKGPGLIRFTEKDFKII